MIEFRELTRDENRSMTHFCARCNSEQKRFELHHCTPAPRWIMARAAMRANGHVPVVHLGEPSLRKNVHSEPVHLSSAVHLPAEEAYVDMDKIEVDKVDSEKTLTVAREEKRREYEREYKRRKRAEAKQ